MSKTNRTRVPEGIEAYHLKACRSHNGGRCNCTPSYRAKVTGPNGRVVSPRFPTIAAARNWRTDTLHAVNAGTFVQPTALTVRQAAAEFIDGAKAGHIMSRNGEPYSPSTIRDYEGDLARYVLPMPGDERLSDVRRGDAQRLVDALVKRGLKGSTVRNALDPLRRIFTRAVQRDLIPFSPCQNLDVPRATGTRDRIATPTEAAGLIAALAAEDRPLWATLFYAGLRIGEARALRCCDVDLAASVMRVCRSWDDKEGAQDRGKTKAATREIAIIGELRPFLTAHMLATGRRGDDLIFGRTATEALTRSTVRTNALRAWKNAKLASITPHECRHTYGSMIAAAGWDVSERQRQMGHASSAMMDRYTHGLDGSVSVADEAPAVARHAAWEGHRVIGPVGQPWDGNAPAAAVLSGPERDQRIVGNPRRFGDSANLQADRGSAPIRSNPRSGTPESPGKAERRPCSRAYLTLRRQACPGAAGPSVRT